MALEFLENKGDNDLEPGPGQHDKLAKKFENSALAARKVVGEKLVRLVRARVQADYYIHYNLSKNKSRSLEEETQKIIAWAEQIITSLKQIP